MKKKDVLVIITPVIIQSLLYFLAKLFAFSPHLLTSSLDQKIPFIPSFVYFYVLWYLLLILGPIIIFKYSHDKIITYNKMFFINSIICFIIFIVYPTTINRVPGYGSSLTNFILQIIYLVDTPILNCFPSIHVLNCLMWISFITFNKEVPFKIRFIVGVFSLLIILSTLFIKQHVLYDLLGSLIVIIISYILLKIRGRIYENRNS